MPLTSMFQIITPNLRAVALMAETLPFLKLIRLKKSESGVESFRFPIALAALLSAIFNRLLPFGIRLERTLPPLILLLGASLSQLAKCLADGNCRIPSNPTSLINDNIVEWLNPSMAIRSTPSKY